MLKKFAADYPAVFIESGYELQFNYFDHMILMELRLCKFSTKVVECLVCWKFKYYMELIRFLYTGQSQYLRSLNNGQYSIRICTAVFPRRKRILSVSLNINFCNFFNLVVRLRKSLNCVEIIGLTSLVYWLVNVKFAKISIY